MKMNIGWYTVYIIACVANAILLKTEGIGLSNLKFWIWLIVPALSYLAGRFMYKED